MAKKIEAVEVTGKAEEVGKSSRSPNKQEDKSLMKFIKNNFLLIIAIVYLIIPIDFLPDVIPLLGYGDDALLLIAGLLRSYVKYQQGKEE